MREIGCSRHVYIIITNIRTGVYNNRGMEKEILEKNLKNNGAGGRKAGDNISENKEYMT